MRRLHELCVGLVVGFLAQRKPYLKARQALGVELDIQVQNIE